MHPELAGKEAEAGTLTDHFTFEQHSAGLNALTHDELVDLRRRNPLYAQRHDFPFVIVVLGHTKPQIFEAMRTRATRDTAVEVNEALDQIALITRRRLRALVGV